MDNQQNPIEFLEDSNLLLVNTAQKKSSIKISIVNQPGETIDRMQLINGRHQIDLSALPNGQYSIRFQCGENVIVKKINIRHVVPNKQTINF